MNTQRDRASVEPTVEAVEEYTDEDMAAVGRAFMEAIEQNRGDPYIKDWSPLQCPSEIIVDLINHHYDEIERLRAQLATARKALEWYGNEQNYRWDGVPMTPYVDGKPDPTKPINDSGQIAREALAALNSGEQK